MTLLLVSAVIPFKPGALPIFSLSATAMSFFFVNNSYCHSIPLFYLLISVRKEFMDDLSNVCDRYVVGWSRSFQVPSGNFVTFQFLVEIYLYLFDLSIAFVYL